MKLAKICFVALAVSVVFAQDPLKAKEENDAGVKAFRERRFTEAVDHFKRALDAYPNNGVARLNLAMSYSSLWQPGNSSASNQANYDLAAQNFQTLLEKDPKNGQALAMMAKMAYRSAVWAKSEQQMAALEEATKWNLRRIEANPNEADGYYSLGLIAWTRANPPIKAAREKAGLDSSVAGSIPDAAVRTALSNTYLPVIKEGIRNLQKCLDLNVENGQAMADLGRLLRDKASVEDSEEAAKADIAQAEQWESAAAKRATSTGLAPRMIVEAAPPPPPPPPPKPAPPGAQRVGGAVMEANLISKVNPQYPPLAKSARVQGTVEFTAVISTEGDVESLQLVRGHPLLVPAAREAVLQWKYRPTLLNGKPVKVITDIIVNFTLSE